MNATSSTAAPRSVRMFHVVPPYTAATPVSTLDSSGAGAGSLLALRVDHFDGFHTAVQDALQALRQDHAGVGIILWVPDFAPPAMRIAYWAGRWRVRSVVYGEEIPADLLLADLTAPLDLGGDVVDWLRNRGLRAGVRLEHLIENIFAHAPQHTQIATLLAAVGESESTARARFRKKGLPSSRCWLQAARALHFALLIQAESSKNLMTLAVENGYADHTTLSQLIVRSFGVRPSAIRGTLGWEWLMDRWYAQNILGRSG